MLGWLCIITNANRVGGVSGRKCCKVQTPRLTSRDDLNGIYGDHENCIQRVFYISGSRACIFIPPSRWMASKHQSVNNKRAMPANDITGLFILIWCCDKCKYIQTKITKYVLQNVPQLTNACFSRKNQIIYIPANITIQPLFKLSPYTLPLPWLI